jgi:macrolide phosphotransferase
VSGRGRAEDLADAITVMRRGWDLDAFRVNADVVDGNRRAWRVSDTLWLTSSQPEYVPSVERELQLLHALAAPLAASGIAVPEPVVCTDGALFEVEGGRVWWITKHIAGRAPDPHSDQDYRTVVIGLAVLHRCLRETHGLRPVSPIDMAQDFELGVQGSDARRALFTSEQRVALADGIDFVRSRLDMLRSLPRQLVHGDVSHPNLLVDERLSGVLDWEWAKIDSVITDLATVGLTRLIRGGGSVSNLDALLDIYARAGGEQFDRDTLVAAMVAAKFGSIWHHGNRYLRGLGSRDLLVSQADKMGRVLQMVG